MPGRLYVADGAGVLHSWLGSSGTIDPPPDPGTDITMVSPVDQEDVVGDRFLLVDVDVSLGATAVEFQVSHFDIGYYPASLVEGSTTLWRSNLPWKSAKSPRDGVTTLPADYAGYIQPRVSTPTGLQVGEMTEVYTLNYPAIKATGLTPAWRAALAHTSDMTTMTAFYASFDGAHGTMNNPNGQPPGVLITEPKVAAGKMVRVTMPDDHTTADQPNSGLRWQVQTQRECVNGDAVWVGFPFRIPVDFPTPTSSHISLFQCMGADAAGSYTLGLTWMFHASTKTSTGGYSDQSTNHWHVNMSDGRYGEPFLTVKLPFERGKVVDLLWGFGFSLDPRKGWVELRYRIEGDPTLIRYEFFGIPGKYRIPACNILPGGTGQRFDQHMYRSRGKFPTVTVDYGQMKIRATPEEADPLSGV